MRVVMNKLIPFRGFKAMNLYGTLFVREDSRTPVTERDYMHEAIHTAQMMDFCKWLPAGGTIFYILYFLEWLWRTVTPPFGTAYRDISFEREAYAHQDDDYYLETRKRFQQWL